jgi:UDP-N-acetylglucosamine--N-acetylmuramyl-(pentapeptide) pyrophosphoryl-undecaprenol N-acetylglucosamine transferase
VSALERIVITTGGTGGHIFPALAVAAEVRRAHPEVDILFVGGNYGPERNLAEAAGLRFAGLPARGVLGRGVRSLGAVWWIGRSLLKSILLLLKFRPQVVVGFGGYAGFCPVLAANVMAIPTAIHEQNSVPGMVNRLLARRAGAIFLSFEDQASAFDPQRTIMTGNPVRPEIAALGERDIDMDTSDGLRLLVFGGSQGARGINQAVVEALPALSQAGVRIVHQTGPADLQSVRAAYEKAGVEARVNAFIEDMAEVYAWAQLGLCRAGATTLAEIAATGLPSILVPYPYAAHDHQTKNAQGFVDADAARMITQNELTPDKLAESVLDLAAKPALLAHMARQARTLARTDAAGTIAREIEKLARKA